VNKSHDQGARDFTPVDRNILADGYPTEELSSDPSIARDWASYTSLNPMEADVLNRAAGSNKQVRKPTDGTKGPGPSESMLTDKKDSF
jgi:hypothetical protein